MPKKLAIIAIVVIAAVFAGFLGYKAISTYWPLLGAGKGNGPAETPLPSNNDSGAISSETSGGKGEISKPLEGRKAIIVIPFKDFNDNEYFKTKEYLLAAGIKSVLTASTETGKASGEGGGNADVNLSIQKITGSDFDAVIFIGGSGAMSLLENEYVQRLARTAFSNQKIIGAIGEAPAILAEAGILKGKNATVLVTLTDRSLADLLSAKGAIFQEKSVVKDAGIITASGPSSADDFGMELIDILIK